MSSSGFPNKIVPGGTLSASEVVGNFEALRDEVNALRDRNFEIGAINTRHISSSIGSGVAIKTQRHKDFTNNSFGLAWTEVAKLTNAAETDGIEFPVPNYVPAPEDEKRIPIFVVASFDIMTEDDSGLSGIGIPSGVAGISTTLMGNVSDNVAYQFQLQSQWNAGYSNASGWLSDDAASGQPITYRKIVVGSSLCAPERSRVVIYSVYLPPLQMKTFTFRLIAKAELFAAVSDPAHLLQGYVSGSLFAFRGVR